MGSAAAANSVGLAAAAWVDYMAGLGAIMLAFLAGSEIRWAVVREHARADFPIRSNSFVAPFLCVLLFTKVVAGWTWSQALIGAIALSTTSVALVHAVVETDRSQTPLGQIVLAARFVNDGVGAVLALGIAAASDPHITLAIQAVKAHIALF